MEGVVVTARRDGANVDVSVVSDAQGMYSFPRTHLEPGPYVLQIRAVGYDLSAPARVEVAAATTATADLALRKTTDLSQGHLTSLEWLMSLPGHAGYQMVVDSKGNPYITDFMGSYIVKVEAATKEGKFLKVPTPDSMPRRGRMDAQDRFWFGEYRGDKIGMLDTRTETFKEWPMPYKYMTPYTASAPDAKGRVYAPSNTSDRLVRLDPNTGETVTYLMPTQDFDTKKIAIDPNDGTTVWFANKRSARIVKVEPLD